MLDWIKTNKKWIIALGTGIAGLLAALGVVVPGWVADIWNYIAGM